MTVCRECTTCRAWFSARLVSIPKRVGSNTRPVSTWLSRTAPSPYGTGPSRPPDRRPWPDPCSLDRAVKEGFAAMFLTRRSTLAITAAASLPWPARAEAEPILAGVSGPLTGPNAQYGAQWKRGFDHALEGINGKGGIDGRSIAYQFED